MRVIAYTFVMLLITACTVNTPQEPKTDVRPGEEASPATPQARQEPRTGIFATAQPPSGPNQHTRSTIAFKLTGIEATNWGLTKGRIFSKPAVVGTLRIVDRHTVIFRADTHFKPATHYAIRLKSLMIDGKEVHLTSPALTEFTTPEFTLMGVHRAHIDYQRGYLRVHMQFNGEVSLDEIRQNTTWLIDQSTPRLKPQYEQGRDTTQVQVSIRNPNLSPKSMVKLALAPFKNGGSKSGGDHTVMQLRLDAGPSVEIQGVMQREGIRSFFIDVVCRDNASGGRRSFWDSDFSHYFRVSDRCQPRAEDVQKYISVEPKVDFKVVGWRGGFRLQGNFKTGTYRLRIRAGLQTIDGGKFATGFDSIIKVPNRTISPRRTCCSG
jgi:hypothetical protein